MQLKFSKALKNKDFFLAFVSPQEYNISIEKHSQTTPESDLDLMRKEGHI